MQESIPVSRIQKVTGPAHRTGTDENTGCEREPLLSENLFSFKVRFGEVRVI